MSCGIKARVLVNQPVAHVVMPKVSVRMPVGTPGPPGVSGTEVEAVAGQNLSAGRVVVVSAGKVYYFQPSNPAHAGRAYGVTKQAVSANDSVRIAIAGDVTDAAFSFAADTPLFAGADGEIAPTPPGGLVQYVGFGLGGNKIHIHFFTTLIR